MKIISLVLLAAVLLYASKPVLTFRPFSLTFEAPYLAGGVFFLLVSLSFLRTHYINETTSTVIKHIHSLMSEECFEGLVKSAEKNKE